MTCRWWHLMIVSCLLLAAAQTASSQYAPRGGAAPYEPAVPSPPQTYASGYGTGYGGGTTAAGSTLQGMSSVINAAGNRNLSNSAAAVNYSQAQKQEISNYNSAVTTYYQTREMNEAYEKAQRGPPPTAAELNRLAQEGMPKPLPTQQLDPVTGVIAWPDLLQAQPFASQRAELEKALRWRAHYGAFTYAQLQVVESTTTAVLGQLKSMVRDADPMEYAAAKDFVESLAYAARKPA